MLNLLKIKNIALIDELSVDFGEGLNLLTGETGSGKSIVVDALGTLTGERVSSDLIKDGQTKAQIEGLFSLGSDHALGAILDEAGIETESVEETELIVRREIAANGRNRVFVNNQLVTQGFLKKIGAYLADIHGQGEQTALFSPSTHLEILDEFASVAKERGSVAAKYAEMSQLRAELEGLQDDEAQKLQLLDILRFQTDEIGKANLEAGEEESLEEEKKRLNNVERLSEISGRSYALLYEDQASITSNLEKISRYLDELSEYDSGFNEYEEGLSSSRAVLEELAYSLRDFRGTLEYSPARLAEIEERLSEIYRLKRKYGGSVESVLQHFAESKKRLENIETAEVREQELLRELAKSRSGYLDAAKSLHLKRKKAAAGFEKAVEKNLQAVALEKATFKVNFEGPEDLESPESDQQFSSNGFDRVEFYFSANPGESAKPLVKVASGGEASRLMLILKTTANPQAEQKSAVFDEVDSGVGGRVAEAVGLKLKELAGAQQVLCVTHHPQVAALADQHFVIEKDISGKQTKIGIRPLDEKERVEEIARMLAGEDVTESARKHARELLKGKKKKGKGTS